MKEYERIESKKREEKGEEGKPGERKKDGLRVREPKGREGGAGEKETSAWKLLLFPG